MKCFPVLAFVLQFLSCSPAQKGEVYTEDTSSNASTTICGHTWTTSNLDVNTYRNGDPIPQVTDPLAWVALTTGAWCWYNNDSATFHNVGRLYNWYAVNDPRGLAPEGWHVLTDTEWGAMESCLGEDTVGYRIRSAGAGHWPGPATDADNSSGFSGLPSGMRSEGGVFSHAGSSAVYWTSVSGSETDAWCVRLIHHINNKGIPAMITGVGYMGKSDGYAVRCVKDR